MAAGGGKPRWDVDMDNELTGVDDDLEIGEGKEDPVEATGGGRRETGSVGGE